MTRRPPAALTGAAFVDSRDREGARPPSYARSAIAPRSHREILSREKEVRTGSIGNESDRPWVTAVGHAACMPWNKTEPMNERVKFMAEWLRHEEPVTTLCKDAGIAGRPATNGSIAMSRAASQRSPSGRARRGHSRTPSQRS